MSGMKRAADAAPRFQERLKTQITRSTAVLLTAFLLLFGVLLAIYSEGYTYYENREYNRQLTEAFRDTYLSCADYLRSGDNMAVMESFLTGEITELNMSYQFHRFSYSSHRVSDLLLLNGDGAAAFSTMAEPSSHLLYFCQSVIPRLTERTDVYTTIYYMTAGGSRLLFARQLDGLGYAFLLLDGSEWNRSMGRLPYDYVVTDTGGTVMVASNAEWWMTSTASPVRERPASPETASSIWSAPGSPRWAGLWYTHCCSGDTGAPITSSAACALC